MTYEQLQATKTSGNDAAMLALVDVMGGPNGVEPGASASVLDELGPGSYALICFIRSADGVSHYVRGMVAPFTVTEAKGKAARPPKPKAEILMNEFGYAFPDTMPRKGVVSVTNVGAQDHELGFFRVEKAATLDEARQGVLGVVSADGTRVVHEAGGIVGLEPDATGYVELDLKPGRYVAVCFFPDPNKGNVPHLLEGMFQELEVE